jgi:hypothetical protein
MEAWAKAREASTIEGFNRFEEWEAGHEARPRLFNTKIPAMQTFLGKKRYEQMLADLAKKGKVNNTETPPVVQSTPAVPEDVPLTPAGAPMVPVKVNTTEPKPLLQDERNVTQPLTGKQMPFLPTTNRTANDTKHEWQVQQPQTGQADSNNHHSFLPTTDRTPEQQRQQQQHEQQSSSFLPSTDRFASLRQYASYPQPPHVMQAEGDLSSNQL